MRKMTILLIGLIIISVGFLSGCNSDYNSNYGSYNDDDYKSYLVKYKVTGTADSVSVTYANEDGGTSQKSEVYLPWSHTMYPMKSRDFVYISAQNNGKYGSVTTEIYVDGELFKTSSSDGAYVIATSSELLP